MEILSWGSGIHCKSLVGALEFLEILSWGYGSLVSWVSGSPWESLVGALEVLGNPWLGLWNFLEILSWGSGIPRKSLGGALEGPRELRRLLQLSTPINI